MHGRIKVKTTAEQAEQKRKERDKKLKLFQSAVAVTHKKMETKEFDDEGLAVTQQILNMNSDYASMWHYRKRVFLSWKKIKNKDEMNKTFEDELAFIASCLRNNPKSYGCWHHRCFVMLTMPNPDWGHELSLCDQFFQFDDRNFHCWDYRRFVVKNSEPKVSLDHEIECTNKLVENNFSNYSSWHYRSKLLPLRYPHLSANDRIEESKLLEELELVQNAFFTDPNDQSAWFYHRWLLGRGNTSQGLIAIHVYASPPVLECVFRKPINEAEVTAAVSVTVNDTIQEGSWKRLIGESGYQHAWVFMFSAPLSDKISKSINVKYVEQSFDIILEAECEQSMQSCISHDEFRQELSSAKLELLQSELESCRQLNDLEPGNKWAILTLVLLMRAVNPAKHRTETDKLVTELMTVDSTRQQYYADLHSKFMIEDCISDREWKSNEVNISGRGLTRICHLQYFTAIERLDLSRNRLKVLSGPFHLLLNCKVILADENEIEDISGLKHMKKLTRISLNQNSLREVDALKPLLRCSNLMELEVTGNSVCDQRYLLEELFPELTIKF